MVESSRNFQETPVFFVSFFVLNLKIMKLEKNKKKALLDAFDKSETKKASEAVKIAGVSLSLYYFHQYRDPLFRQAVLKKQRDYLTERIASV